MITHYKLKNENNEDVLYLYLDFSYEFALFNFKDFGKNLRKKIDEIIKIYKASKIKIVIGSLVIATLLVVPITEKNITLTNDIVYLETLNDAVKDDNTKIIDKVDVVIKPEKVEEVKVDTTTTIEEVKKSNTQTNVPKTTTNTSSKTTNKTNSYTNTATNKTTTTSKTSTSTNTTKPTTNVTTPTTTTTVKPITTPTTSPTNTQTITTTPKEVIDNNTYVTVHRSNGSVITLELEEYLIGVVGSEMPASFNIEALKAQSVVARTYTLKRLSQNKTFTDTTSTQTYKSNSELMSMWGGEYEKYYSKIKSAVVSTKGISIKYNGDYIDAVYHSTSNGYTEDSVYVWGYSIPYLKSVESHWDINASSYKRETYFSYEKMNELLNMTIDINTIFELKRDTSNRVTEVKVNDTIIKGTDFRTKLGLRSTDFIIEMKSDNILITTYGYGHGVGMSQYGANGMANEGYNYIQILNHYYQNIKIES